MEIKYLESIILNSDSIYYTREIIWADHNVLWTYKFTSNVPDHDK